MLSSGAVYGPLSFLTPPVPSFGVGQVAAFVVETRDRFNDTVLQGGAVVDVKVTLLHPDLIGTVPTRAAAGVVVTDLQNGKYSVTVRIPEPGQWNCNVSINSYPLVSLNFTASLGP
jgi:hypothetical protein